MDPATAVCLFFLVAVFTGVSKNQRGSRISFRMLLPIVHESKSLTSQQCLSHSCLEKEKKKKDGFIESYQSVVKHIRISWEM